MEFIAILVIILNCIFCKRPSMPFKTKAGKIRWGIKLSKTLKRPQCAVRMLFLSLFFQSHVPQLMSFPVSNHLITHLPASLIFLPQVYQSLAFVPKPRILIGLDKSSMIILTLDAFQIPGPQYLKSWCVSNPGVGKLLLFL